MPRYERPVRAGGGSAAGDGRAGAPAEPEVLHDISFHRSTGIFRWLLGPSGAGKTSVLRLLILAVRPTRERLGLIGGVM